MTTFNIIAGRPTIDKDPAATLDYRWDWSKWLAEIGDTLSTVLVTSADPSVVVNASSHAAGVVTARISGGVIGTTVGVSCRITSTAGLVDERTIYLRILQR